MKCVQTSFYHAYWFTLSMVRTYELELCITHTFFSMSSIILIRYLKSITEVVVSIDCDLLKLCNGLFCELPPRFSNFPTAMEERSL